MNKMLFFLLITGLLSACADAPRNDQKDTTTSGKIRIAADETYRSMVDSEILVFKSEYQNADISVDYMPEAFAVKEFLSDSVRAIVIGRELNPSEIKTFKDRKKYDPKTVRLATDAIAVIVHPSNTVSELTVEQLKNILNGTTGEWQNGKKIEVVMDNAGSGSISFLQDSVLQGSSLGKSVYALQAGQKMTDYIAAHPHAIGFIGVNLITSFDADANQLFPDNIKPLAIAKDPSGKSYKPYQAYVASRNYPLLRFTNMIIDEAYNGLASGFATFMASDKGQRIILKDGLVPANAPIRLVEVNTSGNNDNSNQ